MKIDELKPAVKKVKRNRVGRGIGSGNGKTSARGQKGQKSRSGGGVRRGFEGGQTPLFRRLPKRGLVRRGFEGGQTPLFRRLPKRGFNNIHSKTYTEVTLKMLSKVKNTDVTAESLLEEGIIGKINDGIVILATGKLDKKVNVKAKRFTAKAKEEIEALGGKAEVI